MDLRKGTPLSKSGYGKSVAVSRGGDSNSSVSRKGPRQPEISRRPRHIRRLIAMATRRLSKVRRTHRALEAGAALEASPQIGRFALEFGVQMFSTAPRCATRENSCAALNCELAAPRESEAANAELFGKEAPKDRTERLRVCVVFNHGNPGSPRPRFRRERSETDNRAPGS
jgi:hypothetical protein